MSFLDVANHFLFPKTSFIYKAFVSCIIILVIEGEIVERSDHKLEITINDPEGILEGKPALRLVVNELVVNSREEGARDINVTVGKGRIVVEDDMRHANPEDILTNLSSQEPKSHKGEERQALKAPPGGAGVRWCRDVLERNLGGDLSYEAIEDGRIRAIVTWPVS